LPIEQVREQLRTVSVQRWCMVLLGYICAHLIVATKWRLMVNAAGADLHWRQAVRCCFTGLFSTLFLPSLVGGDVVRAGLGLTLSRSRAGVLLGSLLDRVLDVTVTIIVAGTGMLMLRGPLDENIRPVFWFATSALGLATITILAIFWTLPSWNLPYALRRKSRTVRRARGLIVRGTPQILLALALGVASQLLFVFLMALLSTASGLHVGLRIWIFAFPLSKLFALTPATIAGIGVREAALAMLLAPFGVASAAAISVGLLWETIVVAGGLLAGLLALLPSLTTVRKACIPIDLNPGSLLPRARPR